MSQRATDGGEYGYRLTPVKRNYLSKAAGKQGLMVDGVDKPNYYCAPTLDYNLNQDRTLYKAGQRRTLKNIGLEDAVIRGATAIENAGGQYAADWGYLDEADLERKYLAAQDPNNLAIYGKNKYYTAERIGPNNELQNVFAKWGPSIYAANLPSEAERIKFQGQKPNQLAMDERSAALFAAMKDGNVATSRLQRVKAKNPALFRAPGAPLPQK